LGYYTKPKALYTERALYTESFIYYPTQPLPPQELERMSLLSSDSAGCSPGRVLSVVVFVAVFAVVCLSPAAFAEKGDSNQTASKVEYERLALRHAAGLYLIILAVFAGLVGIGFASNRELNRGEMRRAIAGTVVVAFVFVLIMLFVIGYPRVGEVLSVFTGAVSAVIGFYFGSRTAQQVREAEEEHVGVENVEFRKGEVRVSFRNGGRRAIYVDALYINNSPVEIPRTKVKPGSAEVVSASLAWKAGESYTIKACTSHGVCSEVTVTAPQKKKEGKQEGEDK